MRLDTLLFGIGLMVGTVAMGLFLALGQSDGERLIGVLLAGSVAVSSGWRLSVPRLPDAVPVREGGADLRPVPRHEAEFRSPRS